MFEGTVRQLVIGQLLHKMVGFCKFLQSEGGMMNRGRRHTASRVVMCGEKGGGLQSLQGWPFVSYTNAQIVKNRVLRLQTYVNMTDFIVKFPLE